MEIEKQKISNCRFDERMEKQRVIDSMQQMVKIEEAKVENSKRSCCELTSALYDYNNHQKKGMSSTAKGA
jgi:hypothetical protein